MDNIREPNKQKKDLRLIFIDLRILSISENLLKLKNHV